MKTYILPFLLFISTFCYSQTREEILQKIKVNEANAVKLVDEQLKAYNNRDIEAFLKPFSDSVVVYNFPRMVDFKGKEKMRKIYADLFKNTQDLKCEIVYRIVFGHTVIDQEKVKFNGYEMDALAIYTIKADMITEVHFVPQL